MNMYLYFNYFNIINYDLLLQISMNVIPIHAKMEELAQMV